MSRLVVACLLAACNSTGAVAQRGVAPRPRLPAWDGQPIASPREFALYTEVGTTKPEANIARLQGGAELRVRGGATWHTAVGIEGAPGLLMQRSENLIEPPIGPSLGIGASVRKSVLTGPLAVGLFAGAQGWRVSVRDAIGDTEGVVRPTGLGGVVLGVRRGGVAGYLGVSVQGAIYVPQTRETDEPMRALVGLGASSALGTRIAIADGAALSLSLSWGASPDSMTYGGGLAVSYELP